jgi:hypothetical protein
LASETRTNEASLSDEEPPGTSARSYESIKGSNSRSSGDLAAGRHENFVSVKEAKRQLGLGCIASSLTVQAAEKSAEVIEGGKMSRRQGARFNNPTGGLPAFLSGQASLHFPPPENEMMMAVSRQARSTDEGPNQ